MCSIGIECKAQIMDMPTSMGGHYHPLLFGQGSEQFLIMPFNFYHHWSMQEVQEHQFSYF